jgi:uncharacterized iron-regulated protein
MNTRRALIAAIFAALVFSGQTNHSAVPPAVEYGLEISFDVARAKLIGAAQIQVSREKPLRLQVGGLTLRSVRLNQQSVDFQVRGGTLTVVPSHSGTLQIAYDGTFTAAPVPANSRDAHFAGVIGEQGIFLGSGWYPEPDPLAKYRLTATVPAGYVAVSEAEKVDRLDTREGVRFTFTFDHPVDHINFVATDRYELTQERFHGVDLEAYFFREDRVLARRYLDYTKRYIDLYEKLLLPFPFKRFAIVENFLPTGYSMPTFTLLGQEVVRLPFIVETSLGHEILHQWFGNLVYINYQRGNWAEGLTTYLADHYYQEQKGEGWKYRKQLLVDYTGYVRSESEVPLREFSQRFDPASRAIGYGKTAMLFHMLRQRLGDEAFFGALRRFVRDNQFERASWVEIERAFQDEGASDNGLKPFFAAWTEQKGLAQVDIGDYTIEGSGGGYALRFELRQTGGIYPLDVPVKVIDSSDREKIVNVRLEERQKSVRIDLDNRPAKLIVDEDYDLARRLAEPELPAVIGSLLAAEKLLVVLPAGDARPYQDVIDSFRAKGAELKGAESLTGAEIRSMPLLVLGSENPVLGKLYGKLKMPDGGFNVALKKNPWNALTRVAIVTSSSAAETRAAFSKIQHYGKYSALRFENGRNVSATVEPSERGIQKVIPAAAAPAGSLTGKSEEPIAVDVKTLQSLSKVVDSLADKKIVYVGESHDNFSHHQVQLEILSGLYRQTPKIAIGMEMFQRPFQKVLEDYTSGAIDERTFLRRSEYFKRWDVDYHLYKPILDFARAQRLPVVALNVRREIVDKVGRSGIDSLSAEEKREIPQKLDLSDEAYRARLQQVFDRHQGAEKKNFDFFHQAQVLWDETMAESADRFLQNRADYRLIVLAGGGHLQYGSGIPKRVFQRNGLPYAIVLNDADIEKDIADFVVFPTPSSGAVAPKLMVSVEEQDKKVRITGFSKNSVAEKAGLKVQDALLSLDGEPVESIADVKIALFFKKPGDTIKVKAQRSDPTQGEQQLDFDVKLE